MGRYAEKCSKCYGSLAPAYAHIYRSSDNSRKWHRLEGVSWCKSCGRMFYTYYDKKAYGSKTVEIAQLKNLFGKKLGDPDE